MKDQGSRGKKSISERLTLFYPFEYTTIERRHFRSTRGHPIPLQHRIPRQERYQILSRWQKKQISLPIGRKGRVNNLFLPIDVWPDFSPRALAAHPITCFPRLPSEKRRGCLELSTLDASPSTSSLGWFGHLSHTGFKTSLPSAVGSSLSSDGISTDNADRVDGHLAEESTDTSATCLYRRGEEKNP